MPRSKHQNKSILPIRLADIIRIYQLRNYLWQARTKGFEIPSQPHFDEQGILYFCEHIKSSQVYLEYGSGGSTLVAARYVGTLISVDSDKQFLRSVEKVIESGRNQTRKLIHANIGLTEQWGRPVIRKLTRGRARRWSNYSHLPWQWLRRHNLEPDTILVDGRFRVACVLESIKNMKTPDNCKILFDDYAEREYYHIVEAFCILLRMEGRMAILQPKRNIDQNSLLEKLTEAQQDFR